MRTGPVQTKRCGERMLLMNELERLKAERKRIEEERQERKKIRNIVFIIIYAVLLLMVIMSIRSCLASVL